MAGRSKTIIMWYHLSQEKKIHKNRNCVKWLLKHQYSENREAPTGNPKFIDDLTRAILMKCPNNVGEEIQLLLSQQESWILFEST